MNLCRGIQTASELSQIFLGRFQLLPQPCLAALPLGFKCIVRYARYHPTFPFRVYGRGLPFKDFGEAARFHQQKAENAHNNMSNFTEETRERLASQTFSEDDEQIGPFTQPRMHF